MIDSIEKKKGKYGHLPWYRRYEFLYPFMIIYAALIIFVMPPVSRLNIFGYLMLIVAVVIYVFVLVAVQTDREKPNWLKNIFAFGVILIFGLFFYRYSGARWSEVGHYFFNMDVMRRTGFMEVGEAATTTNWELMFRALWTAIEIFLMSAVLSTLLALLLAVVRVIVNDKLLNFFIELYVDVFRAVPSIALLLVIYFSLPYAGILLSPFATGVLALTLIEGAYLCEVFRSGIEAIHKNQVESARALGMTAWKAMKLVVLPQSIKIVLPPYTNRMIGLMKRTAECSVIAIAEILQTARQLQSWYANATPLIIGALMYMIFLFPLTRAATILERRRKSA